MNNNYQQLNVQDLPENLKASKQVNLQGKSNAYNLYSETIRAVSDI